MRAKHAERRRGERLQPADGLFRLAPSLICKRLTPRPSACQMSANERAKKFRVKYDKPKKISGMADRKELKNVKRGRPKK